MMRSATVGLALGECLQHLCKTVNKEAGHEGGRCRRIPSVNTLIFNSSSSLMSWKGTQAFEKISQSVTPKAQMSEAWHQ